jgi:hypothetical protein
VQVVPKVSRYALPDVQWWKALRSVLGEVGGKVDQNMKFELTEEALVILIQKSVMYGAPGVEGPELDALIRNLIQSMLGANLMKVIRED